MTLDPSWRQTLRLPLPGIEPGSPASQAGTLPKELLRQLTPVLRIRDFYPRSRILIFSHPGSWIQNSNKKRGEKKLVIITFYVAKNFTKLQIISVLNCWRKFFWLICLRQGSNQGHLRHRQALYLTSYLDSSYQCCGSGMFIPDPRSWFLAIPDPGSKTATKERGEKNLLS